MKRPILRFVDCNVDHVLGCTSENALRHALLVPIRVPVRVPYLSVHTSGASTRVSMSESERNALIAVGVAQHTAGLEAKLEAMTETGGGSGA